MSVFTYAIKVYKRVSRAQYLAWVVIVIAVAALFAVGFFLGRNSAAATMRDCGDGNSIALNSDSGGGCGSLTPQELITDINNGDPDDQAGIYAHFGLPASEYNRFKNTAVDGMAYKDGTIKVGDQTVMTEAWSIGRKKFDYSKDYVIDGVGTYYKSNNTDVLKDNLPVMVMFDNEGTAEVVVIKSCGNPVKGKPKKSGAKCEDLIKHEVKDKENTFSFSTKASKFGLAEYTTFLYYYNDGSGDKLLDTKNSPEEKTKAMTFTKDTTVTVKFEISLPGGKKKVIESELCKEFIEVKQKEVPPPAVVEKPKPKPQVLPAKVEQPPLPVTGPADAAGVFTGATLAGTVGHYLYFRYRNRRQR